MDRYQKVTEEKAKKKRALLGSMFFPRTPVVLLDFSNSHGDNDFDDLVDGLINLDVMALVVPGSKKSQWEEHKNIRVLRPEEIEKAYDAADCVVALDSDLQKVWAKGCVPIARMGGNGTENYNPLQEKGNGFYFKNATKWEIFAAIVRALETYQFPYDWGNLIKEILKK